MSALLLTAGLSVPLRVSALQPERSEALERLLDRVELDASYGAVCRMAQCLGTSPAWMLLALMRLRVALPHGWMPAGEFVRALLGMTALVAPEYLRTGDDLAQQRRAASTARRIEGVAEALQLSPETIWCALETIHELLNWDCGHG